MMSVYEDNANEVAEALKTYQLSLESVLGTGWKGKAAEKFTAIIEEYEKTTQEFISKINSFKGLMEQCGGKYTLLDSEAKKLNEQNKNGDVDGLYNG
jgi:uncharacterized protein YukE